MSELSERFMRKLAVTVLVAMTAVCSFYMGKHRADIWWQAYNKALEIQRGGPVFIGHPGWLCFDDTGSAMPLANGNNYKTPECYKRPHYILGVLFGFFSVCLLFLGLRCWIFAFQSTKPLFFLVGVFLILGAIGIMSHAFDLVEFRVAPCAKIEARYL